MVSFYNDDDKYYHFNDDDDDDVTSLAIHGMNLIVDVSNTANGHSINHFLAPLSFCR